MTINHSINRFKTSCIWKSNSLLLQTNHQDTCGRWGSQHYPNPYHVSSNFADTPEFSFLQLSKLLYLGFSEILQCIFLHHTIVSQNVFLSILKYCMGFFYRQHILSIEVILDFLFLRKWGILIILFLKINKSEKLSSNTFTLVYLYVQLLYSSQYSTASLFLHINIFYVSSVNRLLP